MKGLLGLIGLLLVLGFGVGLVLALIAAVVFLEVCE